MTYKFSFILTSLDLHTLDLDDFKYAETNITAFRLIDRERPEVQQVIREWSAMARPSDLSLLQPSAARANSYGGNGFYGDPTSMMGRPSYFSGLSYDQQQSSVSMRVSWIQWGGNVLTHLHPRNAAIMAAFRPILP